jgi:hypothetical protein
MSGLVVEYDFRDDGVLDDLLANEGSTAQDIREKIKEDLIRGDRPVAVIHGQRVRAFQFRWQVDPLVKQGTEGADQLMSIRFGV